LLAEGARDRLEGAVVRRKRRATQMACADGCASAGPRSTAEYEQNLRPLRRMRKHSRRPLRESLRIVGTVGPIGLAAALRALSILATVCGVAGGGRHCSS
jgi:hypothetical protein